MGAAELRAESSLDGGRVCATRWAGGRVRAGLTNLRISGEGAARQPPRILAVQYGARRLPEQSAPSSAACAG